MSRTTGDSNESKNGAHNIAGDKLSGDEQTLSGTGQPITYGKVNLTRCVHAKFSNAVRAGPCGPFAVTSTHFCDNPLVVCFGAFSFGFIHSVVYILVLSLAAPLCVEQLFT